MQYGILPLPHPNARYQAGLNKLYQAELEAFAQSGIAAITGAGYSKVGGLDLITFEAPALSDHHIQALHRLSATLAVFELLPEGLLRPLEGSAQWAIDQDLAGLMKYKGKTNEAFTRLMISLALHFSDYAGQWDQKLSLLDPLCGRGTTLYCALERGFHATGIEMDKADIAQIKQMVPRYLQYHRISHAHKTTSFTVKGHPAGDCLQWEIAAGGAAKAQDGLSLWVIRGDATLADRYMKKKHHLLVADLPYGVQHSGEGGAKGAEGLLQRCAPAWKSALLPGGAMAISFNRHTLPRERVAEILAEAGLTPVENAPFDDLSHFVEQAVMRDVVIAQNKGGAAL